MSSIPHWALICLLKSCYGIVPLDPYSLFVYTQCKCACACAAGWGASPVFCCDVSSVSFAGSFPQDGRLHAGVCCQPAMTKTSSQPATCPCGLVPLHTHSHVCRKARFPVWQGLAGAGIHIQSHTFSSASFVLRFIAYIHRCLSKIQLYVRVHWGYSSWLCLTVSERRVSQL